MRRFRLVLPMATVVGVVSLWGGGYLRVARVFIGGETSLGSRQHLIESARGWISFRYWIAQPQEAGISPNMQCSLVSVGDAGPLQADWSPGQLTHLGVVKIWHPVGSLRRLYVVAVPYWAVAAVVVTWLCTASLRWKRSPHDARGFPLDLNKELRQEKPANGGCDAS